MRVAAAIDVAIVGAGPAGCAAAIALARAGRRVVLFEKAHPPRAKVCGGCLSGQAVTHLRRLLGDLPEGNEAGPGIQPLGVPAKQITFFIGSYRLTVRPRGRTRIVLRSAFDAYLAGVAAAAGADVRFGQPARLVRGDEGDAWDVIAGEERFRARWILLASGLNSIPASLGLRGRPQRQRLVGQQWVQPAGPGLPGVGGVEMHWLRGGYVGLGTPAPDTVLVGLAAEVDELAGEPVWRRLRLLNPGAPIWSVLPDDAPRRFGARGAAGFPWVPEQLGVDNVLLIGDAAGYIEPFTGEGMGQALRSAACAVEALHGETRGPACGPVCGPVCGPEAHTPLARYTTLMRQRQQPAARRLAWLGALLRTRAVHWLASGPPWIPRDLLAPLVRWVHVGAPA